MTSARTVCPDCGTERSPEARFCSHCGRSLAPARAPIVERSGPADAPLVVEASGASVRTLAPVMALVLTAVMLAAFVGLYLLLTRAPLPVSPRSPATLDPANVPPPGVVWFGSSYDGRTLALSGRGATVGAGTTAAMVASLAAPVGPGQAAVRVDLGGTPMASNRLNMSAAAAGDVVAWTLAFPVAGSYRVSVVDAASGAVLATGSVAAQ